MIITSLLLLDNYYKKTRMKPPHISCIHDIRTKRILFDNRKKGGPGEEKGKETVRREDRGRERRILIVKQSVEREGEG